MPDTTACPPPRSARYRDAVALVRGRPRVRLSELTRELRLDPETADIFLSCMQAEAILGARQPDGWWPVLSGAEAGPIEPELARLDQALARLEQAIARGQEHAAGLQDRCVAAERRILEMERRQRAKGDGTAEEQLAAVKRLLARELHPDLPGSAAERALREALFKRLWPLLAAAERGAASR